MYIVGGFNMYIYIVYYREGSLEGEFVDLI